MTQTTTLEELLTVLDGGARVVNDDGHEVRLTTAIAVVLQTAVAGLLHDNSDALTTEQTAKLIGMSRPTLIRLLDQRMIPFHRTHGDHGHRRIRRQDALAFLRDDLARRREVLDQLALDATAMGFFDE